MNGTLALALLAAAAPYGGCPVVSYEQNLEVTGLWRDPNPFSKVPKGALSRADEVVIRRKGTAEPRPGFKEEDVGEGTGITALHKMIPFGGSVLHIGNAVTQKTAWLGFGGAVQDESAADLQWTFEHARGEEARKNLYLTTEDAIRKLTASTDFVADRAGLPAPVIHLEALSAATAIIGVGQRVAYRAVFKRTDANNLTVRGAPSGRLLYNNATGAAEFATVKVWWNTLHKIVAGDFVELYRTTLKSTVPSDEMFLAWSKELSSTDITNGYLEIEDTRLDTDLGAALYTNPSREGIERSNTQPPSAKDLALYQGSLFASRIKYPHGIRLTMGEDAVSKAGVATGVGYRTTTGDLTNGSNVITNVVTTVGVQIGMLVRASSPLSQTWTGTGPVRVTAVTANSVTVNVNWNGATTLGTGVTFADSIKIVSGATTEYFTAFQPSRTIVEFAADDPDIGGPFGYRTTKSVLVQGFALGDTTSMRDGVTETALRRIAITRFLASHTGFEISATHGNEYEPPLPLPTAANGEPSTQDDFQNGIAWSKGDQPEHFMIGAVRLVGKQQVPILRSVRAGNAVWLLKGKGDGIYRLSGFGERSGWRVDEFDLSVYLLHEDAAVAMGDSVYAWTNMGMVKISDAGVVPISAPAIGSDTGSLEELFDHTLGNGFFSVANEKAGEVIFGLPHLTNDAVWDGTARHVYVFNTGTKAWSKWFDSSEYYTCAAYDTARRLLMFGRADSGIARVERAADELFLNADREYAITISSVSGVNITINGGSGWTPAVGDLVTRPFGSHRIVTAVTDATHFAVNATGLSSGAAGAYESYQSDLKWLPKAGDSPSLFKSFKEVVTHWENTDGVYSWGVVAEASRNIGTESVFSYTRALSRDFAADSPDDHRSLMSRDVALTTRLFPGLRIKQADSRWRVSGMTLGYENVSARVSR